MDGLASCDAAGDHRQPRAVQVGRLGERTADAAPPNRQGKQRLGQRSMPPAWAVSDKRGCMVTSVDALAALVTTGVVGRMRIRLHLAFARAQRSANDRFRSV